MGPSGLVIVISAIPQATSIPISSFLRIVAIGSPSKRCAHEGDRNLGANIGGARRGSGRQRGHQCRAAQRRGPCNHLRRHRFTGVPLDERADRWMNSITMLGGTGFPGRRVVRHLRASGPAARSASRHPRANPPLRINLRRHRQ